MEATTLRLQVVPHHYKWSQTAETQTEQNHKYTSAEYDEKFNLDVKDELFDNEEAYGRIAGKVNLCISGRSLIMKQLYG